VSGPNGGLSTENLALLAVLLPIEQNAEPDGAKDRTARSWQFPCDLTQHAMSLRLARARSAATSRRPATREALLDE